VLEKAILLPKKVSPNQPIMLAIHKFTAAQIVGVKNWQSGCANTFNA